MSEQGPEQRTEQSNKKTQREITYQIGRKKGTIAVNKRTESQSSPTPEATLSSLSNQKLTIIEKWWHPAPMFSTKYWLLLLYVSPIIVSSAFLWLFIILDK